MLWELHVRNLAVINDLRLEFGEGLIVENSEPEIAGVSGATHEKEVERW